MVENNRKATLEAYATHPGDTGSAQVQIALITERINSLTGHFRTHRHDNAGRRGLVKMVGQRRKLLRYLHRRDVASYQSVVEKLGLRK